MGIILLFILSILAIKFYKEMKMKNTKEAYYGPEGIRIEGDVEAYHNQLQIMQPSYLSMLPGTVQEEETINKLQRLIDEGKVDEYFLLLETLDDETYLRIEDQIHTDKDICELITEKRIEGKKEREKEFLERRLEKIDLLARIYMDGKYEKHYALLEDLRREGYEITRKDIRREIIQIERRNEEQRERRENSKEDPREKERMTLKDELFGALTNLGWKKGNIDKEKVNYVVGKCLARNQGIEEAIRLYLSKGEKQDKQPTRKKRGRPKGSKNKT